MIHVAAAITAGVAGDIVTNPLYVIKTRIQTLHLHEELPKQEQISITRLFYQIYKTEGVMSFYKGLAASFLGLGHAAIQFPLYEFLKKYTRDIHGGQETAYDIVSSSIASKLVASSFTYPHELLRSRLQDSRNTSKGLIALIKTIIRTEGFFALWKGYGVNVIRLIPSTASAFLTYEYMVRFFYAND